MNDNCNIIAGKDGEPDNLPSFIITESSRILLKSIEDLLGELVRRNDLHPADEEFYNAYLVILEHYDRFQHQVINDSGIDIACRAGCSTCCCHWVEDVNSFEGVIISRYISDNYPDNTEHIINSFREDAELLNSLRTIVDEKVNEYSSFGDEISDKYDLLLSCFYQLERPCALLDDSGRCIIYPVRPLTCRDYLNLRDAKTCLPDRINEEKESTLIMHLSDTVTEHLAILHRRFDTGIDDMSLRSILIYFLESGFKTGY